MSCSAASMSINPKNSRIMNWHILIYILKLKVTRTLPAWLMLIFGTVCIVVATILSLICNDKPWYMHKNQVLMVVGLTTGLGLLVTVVAMLVCFWKLNTMEKINLAISIPFKEAYNILLGIENRDSSWRFPTISLTGLMHRQTFMIEYYGRFGKKMTLSLFAPSAPGVDRAKLIAEIAMKYGHEGIVMNDYGLCISTSYRQLKMPIETWVDTTLVRLWEVFLAEKLVHRPNTKRGGETQTP